MEHKMGWVRVCALMLLVCAAAVTTCTTLRSQPVTTSPALDMRDLMLDLSASPRGWAACAGPERLPKRERGELDSLLVWFCPPGFDGVGGTHQELYKYRNELVASWVYEAQFHAREFPRYNMISPWAVPDEWSYESPVADRFRFACGQQDGGPYPTSVCVSIAQYDEFVSVLVTHPSRDGITLGEVERLVIAIDERMALHLGKDAQ